MTTSGNGQVAGRFVSQAEALDEERFTGREKELALLERVLGEDPPARVVLVHGSGGIGKSALLRALSRRAIALGYSVYWLDGRGAPPTSNEIASTFRELQSVDRLLLLIDTYERISALGAYLREHALGELADSARVVISGREVPGWEWESGPWGAVTLTLALHALSESDAEDLLRRRGVTDAGLVNDLTAWAEGEPLALSAGADAVSAGLTIDTSQLTDDVSLARALITRLARDELSGADYDVLAVASIAHGVDVAMLEEVLPGLDGEHAISWLRSVSFSEAAGPRITIHDRLRRALHTDLRRSNPQYERELRRRLADHLSRRASKGEYHLVAELSDLIEDSRIRWGLGMEAGAAAYADIVRPGDIEVAGTRVEDAAEAWPRLRRWFSEAQEHVYTVRNSAGDLIGFGVWVTTDDAPSWASEDPIVGPRLEHARSLTPSGKAVISRGGRPLSWGTQRSRAAIANPVLVGRLGVDVRYFYGAGFEGRIQQQDFYRAVGYRRVTELDAVEDGRVVECHLLDLGEGAVVGGLRALVYRDLGLNPAPSPRIERDMGEVVREALRYYHDRDVLAASPLAVGSTPEERSGSVRTLLRRATERTFGDSEEERLLRAIIEQGYLNRVGSHESTARRLHLSRATYFRRLAQASERLAETLSRDGDTGQPVHS